MKVDWNRQTAVEVKGLYIKRCYMFKLILSLTILSSSPLLGETFFQCNSDQDSHVVDLSGSLDNWSKERSLLSYDLSFQLKCNQMGSCKYESQSSAKKISNRLEYNPKKYVQHHQFLLPMSTGLLHKKSGSIQLTIPKTAGENHFFRSRLVLDSIQGKFGFTVPLNCQVTGSRSPELNASDDVDEMATKARQMIQEEFGLENTLFDFHRDTLATQLKEKNKIDFLKALKGALINLLHDEDDIESPVGIARLGAEEEWRTRSKPNSVLDHNISRWYLREIMKRGSILSFTLDPFPPENGEEEHLNWIFRLQVDRLSDHLYWSVQAKDGSYGPYNYGFN